MEVPLTVSVLQKPQTAVETPLHVEVLTGSAGTSTGSQQMPPKVKASGKARPSALRRTQTPTAAAASAVPLSGEVKAGAVKAAETAKRAAKVTVAAAAKSGAANTPTAVPAGPITTTTPAPAAAPALTPTPAPAVTTATATPATRATTTTTATTTATTTPTTTPPSTATAKAKSSQTQPPWRTPATLVTRVAELLHAREVPASSSANSPAGPGQPAASPAVSSSTIPPWRRKPDPPPAPPQPAPAPPVQLTTTTTDLSDTLEGGEELQGQDLQDAAKPRLLVSGFPPEWSVDAMLGAFRAFGQVSKYEMVDDMLGTAMLVQLEDDSQLKLASTYLTGKLLYSGDSSQAFEVQCDMIGGDMDQQTELLGSMPRKIYVDELPMKSRPCVSPNDDDREIFLKNLPTHLLTEAAIQKAFSRFGIVEDVFLLKDKELDLVPNGCAYVVFSDHDSAASCLGWLAEQAREAAGSIEHPWPIGSWSESERAEQRRLSAYGADVHAAFLGDDGYPVQRIFSVVAVDDLQLMSAEVDKELLEATGTLVRRRLHFLVVCSPRALPAVQEALAEVLEEFHTEKAPANEPPAKKARLQTVDKAKAVAPQRDPLRPTTTTTTSTTTVVSAPPRATSKAPAERSSDADEMATIHRSEAQLLSAAQHLRSKEYRAALAQYKLGLSFFMELPKNRVTGEEKKIFNAWRQGYLKQATMAKDLLGGKVVGPGDIEAILQHAVPCPAAVRRQLEQQHLPKQQQHLQAAPTAKPPTAKSAAPTTAAAPAATATTTPLVLPTPLAKPLVSPPPAAAAAAAAQPQRHLLRPTLKRVVQQERKQPPPHQPSLQQMHQQPSPHQQKQQQQLLLKQPPPPLQQHHLQTIMLMTMLMLRTLRGHEVRLRLLLTCHRHQG